MRNAARTDACQATIIQALRAIGCQVYYVKLPLDLLVSGGPLGNATVLLECKMPGEGLNKAQTDFVSRWPGRVIVAHHEQEAIEAVLGKEMLK